MGIFSFKEFIYEKLGFSEASLIFADILQIRTVGVFEDFIRSGEKSLKKIEVLNWSILRPNLKRKDLQLYTKFPVIKFELDLNFNILNPKEWSKKYSNSQSNTAIGGVASFFGNKNWVGYSKIVSPIKQITENGVIINLGVTIDVNGTFDFDNKDSYTELQDGVASTIYHELNHCYEHYVRVMKYKSIIRPELRSFVPSLTFAGSNIWKFPKQIWKFWNKLNYFLYISEDFEVRANVQEIFYFIKNHPESELSDFRIYQIADEMQKFDHMNFYEQLLNQISTYEPYKGSEKIVAERLKEMWVKTYEIECQKQGAKPIISFATLKKMDCLEFLKYWQRRINSTGETIKRKAHNIKANI
jgi:hypothetical protein